MHWLRISSLLGLGLSLGCGDDSASDDANTSNSSDGTTMGSASDTDSATGPVSATDGVDSTGTTAGPTDGSLGMGHGGVSIELTRGQAETEDPFVGTAQVEVTMSYLECLIGFYEDTPDWSQLGPLGTPVFDAALGEGLCDPAIGPLLADCTVAEIRQELDVVKQLTVTYDVTGPLEGRQLRVGPLPTVELAACTPLVRVSTAAAVRGLDGAGDVLWQTESFNPSEATTDQGAPITIRATRP